MAIPTLSGVATYFAIGRARQQAAIKSCSPLWYLGGLGSQESLEPLEDQIQTKLELFPVVVASLPETLRLHRVADFWAFSRRLEMISGPAFQVGSVRHRSRSPLTVTPPERKAVLQVR